MAVTPVDDRRAVAVGRPVGASRRASDPNLAAVSGKRAQELEQHAAGAAYPRAGVSSRVARITSNDLREQDA